MVRKRKGGEVSTLVKRQPSEMSDVDLGMLLAECEQRAALTEALGGDGCVWREIAHCINEELKSRGEGL